MRSFLAGVLVVTFFFGCAAVEHRNEIGVLVDYGKNQEDQEKELKAETKIFEKMKEAAQAGQFTRGMTAREVVKKFGKPVVKQSHSLGEKWAYKASNQNWFQGEILRLYFDASDRLSSWDCHQFECPSTTQKE